jgi:hypothetical protein
MGYLSGDRDFNREYRFERERPDRDYLGGRENRNFEHRYNERARAESERAAVVSKQKREDYLLQEGHRQELDRMAEQAREKVRELARTLAVERSRVASEKVTSDAQKMITKFVFQLTRVAAAVAVARYVGIGPAITVAGLGTLAAIGSFGLAIITPSEISCGEGEKCVRR